MYGDEETGTLPEELYSNFDAVNATKMCDTIHEFVKKLIVQWYNDDIHTKVPLDWNYLPRKYPVKLW